MAGRATLNITQAATHVGVSRRTIYNWLQAGKLEYARTAGGNVRIYTDALLVPGAESFGSDTPERTVVASRNAAQRHERATKPRSR